MKRCVFLLTLSLSVSFAQPTATTVHARLVTRDGKPLTQTAFHLHMSIDGFAVLVPFVTDGDGAFSFEVLSRQYSLSVQLPGYATKPLLDEELGIQYAKQTLDFVCDVAQKGSLRGVVTMPDSSSPASGASVTLLAERPLRHHLGTNPEIAAHLFARWVAVAQTQADASGSYEFAGIDAGSYALVVSGSYYQPENADRGRDRGSPDSVFMGRLAFGGLSNLQYREPPSALRECQPAITEDVKVIPHQVTRLTTTLLHGGTIRGIVIDKETGQPVARQPITIESFDDLDEIVPFARYRTAHYPVFPSDDNGRFEIRGLLAGAYLFNVNGLDATSLGATVGYSTPASSSKELILPVRRRKVATIEGRVLSSVDASPLEGVRVSVVTPTEPPQSATVAITDKSGMFLIDQMTVRGDVAEVPYLSDGHFTMQRVLQNGTILYVGGTFDSSGHPTVHIRAPDAKLRLQFTSLDGQSESREVPLKDGRLDLEVRAAFKPPRVTSLELRVLAADGKTPVAGAWLCTATDKQLTRADKLGVCRVPLVKIIGDWVLAQLEVSTDFGEVYRYRALLSERTLRLRLKLPDGRSIDVDVKLSADGPTKKDVVTPP